MSSAIEPFQGPGNIEDAVLLVVSSGLRDFIQNTLFSIERSGATENMICIALPKSALIEVSSAVSRWTNVKYILLEDICRSDYSWIRDYHEFGTEAFHRFTTSKWPAIRFLLESGFRRVTYTDVDIAWMRDPMPLLRAALQTFDIAIQTEGVASFPPVYCTGFMSFRNSDFTIELLEKLEKSYPEIAKNEPNAGDQSMFNAIIARSEGSIHHVYGLGEQQFANGLMADALDVYDGRLPKLNAMIFHANWVVGLENKRLLLERTGNWFIDQSKAAARITVRATQKEFDALQEQLDAVYASRSWRATWPLRWVLNQLRQH
jgi:hypothetical protein